MLPFLRAMIDFAENYEEKEILRTFYEDAVEHFIEELEKDSLVVIEDVEKCRAGFEAEKTKRTERLGREAPSDCFNKKAKSGFYLFKISKIT